MRPRLSLRPGSVGGGVGGCIAIIDNLAISLLAGRGVPLVSRLLGRAMGVNSCDEVMMMNLWGIVKVILAS